MTFVDGIYYHRYFTLFSTTLTGKETLGSGITSFLLNIFFILCFIEFTITVEYLKFNLGVQNNFPTGVKNIKNFKVLKSTVHIGGTLYVYLNHINGNRKTPQNRWTFTVFINNKKLPVFWHILEVLSAQVDLIKFKPFLLNEKNIFDTEIVL